MAESTCGDLLCEYVYVHVSGIKASRQGNVGNLQWLNENIILYLAGCPERCDKNIVNIMLRGIKSYSFHKIGIPIADAMEGKTPTIQSHDIDIVRY